MQYGIGPRPGPGGEDVYKRQIHPYWETLTCVDSVITASELLTYRAVKRGIPARRIQPLGIPVHPKFQQRMEKAEAKQLLGLRPDVPGVLMMGCLLYTSGNTKCWTKRCRISRRHSSKPQDVYKRQAEGSG